MNATTHFLSEPAVPGGRSLELAIPSAVTARATGRLRGALPVSLAASGAAVLFLAAFGWYAVWAAPSRARVTPAAYERIQAGMSREEVEAAVGVPAADYRHAAHRPGGRRYTEWSEEAGDEVFGGETANRLTWEGNKYSIAVGFDEAGAVTWKTLWKHVPPTPHTPAEKVLDWIGR
ncbi:MAG TPA: hypothetical protein VFW33_14150 [Gemmataceae bacterium]|nr:hypothetical protein [Gemmataceae bacterium]